MTSIGAAQEMAGFLGRECTSLAHIEMFLHQYPQVILCGAALNPLVAQAVLMLGIVSTQMQDFAFGLVELLEVCLGPPVKPVKVLPDGIPFL